MTNQRLTMFVMESSKQQPVGASLLAIWAAEFSSAPRTSALPVRPGGRTYSTVVKVHVGVSQGP